MPSIPDSHRDILESNTLAFLSTIGPKGDPQVSPVWFTWDGSHVLFALNKTRQKVRNLTRQPRVAISMTDPANPYRALEIRGTVERIDPDTDLTYANAVTRKYTGHDASPEEIGRAEDRVLIVVTPERFIPFPA